jgi:hypothetical protein
MVKIVLCSISRLFNIPTIILENIFHQLFPKLLSFLGLDPNSEFPETTEKPGYFVGFEENVGNALMFKILKNDLSTVLHTNDV